MPKKNLCPFLIFGLFLLVSGPLCVAQTPANILKAVVKIKTTIPQDAYTASILGTAREGNGVVIDESGHILTIGYLILEAQTIEIFKTNGKPVKADFVAYDYQTGFGILRAVAPLSIAPLKLGHSDRLKAGVKAGDIVVAVNQKPVKELAEFFRQIWATGPAGVKVTLSILQETQVRDISVLSADRYRFLKVSRQR